MKKIKRLLSVFVSALAVTSCFDMTEHPYTLMDASNYFTDEASVKQAIANIYAQERPKFLAIFLIATPKIVY